MPDNLPDDLEDVEKWHFAVGGLDTQQAILSIGGPFQLHRLKSFPSHEELALNLSSLPIAGIVASYGEKVIRHELVIDTARFNDRPEAIFPSAEAILAGIRIRTGAEVVCPAVCATSWGALVGDRNNSCRVYHFERGVSHSDRPEAKKLLPEDLEWVRDNLGMILNLSESPQFQTAVEALCTYMLSVSDRMRVAQLWAGIESVFDVTYELKYRVSILIARLLSPPSKACREIYEEVKKLYDQRSKIIHGQRVKDDVTRAHIVAVRGYLARILVRLIELGKIPDFEEMLFEQ